MQLFTSPAHMLTMLMMQKPNQDPAHIQQLQLQYITQPREHCRSSLQMLHQLASPAQLVHLCQHLMRCQMSYLACPALSA